MKEFHFSDMIDLKTLAAGIVKNKSINTEGNRVNWMKIKVLRYEKDKPGIILYKYNHEDPEFQTIRTTGRGRTPSIPAQLPSLYKTQLPISATKKQDLLRLYLSKLFQLNFMDGTSPCQLISARKTVLQNHQVSLMNPTNECFV